LQQAHHVAVVKDDIVGLESRRLSRLQREWDANDFYGRRSRPAVPDASVDAQTGRRCLDRPGAVLDDNLVIDVQAWRTAGATQRVEDVVFTGGKIDGMAVATLRGGSVHQVSGF